MVTNSTRCPRARKRAMPSAEPGMDVGASQITPSRSQMIGARAQGGGHGRILPRRRANLTAVPRFEPFGGLRYDTVAGGPLDEVVAPPYDVLSEADRAGAGRSPRANIVRVDCPLEADGPGRYDEAAAHAARSGSTTASLRPTASRASRCTACPSSTRPARHRATVGVIGALEVVDDRRGRRAPPRTDDTQGHDRPARPDPCHRAPTSRRSGVCHWPPGLTGLLARARRADRTRSTTTGCATRSSASTTPTRMRGHRRGRRRRTRAHRRRPPPLRRRPHVPGRAPRHGGRPTARLRSHAGLRRRAGRGAAERRGRSTGSSTACPAAGLARDAGAVVRSRPAGPS